MDLEQDGCEGQRTTRFSALGEQEVYRLSAAWLPRDCGAEGIAEYNACYTVCTDDAETNYTACTATCSTDAI